MKKILLLTCMAIFTGILAFADQNVKNGYSAKGSAAFSTDIIIDDNPDVAQQLTRIATAFNGWQYAAFSNFDYNSFIGGLTVKMSKDNGLNWDIVAANSNFFTSYPAFDMVVTGTDTNDLVLHVAYIANDQSQSTFKLTVDEYNAATAEYLATSLTIDNADENIADVAIASDYEFPAAGTTPYGLGLLYSARSATADSLIFLGSVDGGISWTVNETVASTIVAYFNKVTLAYAHSATASNGVYLAAWESLLSSNADYGSIFTSRTGSTVSSAWNTPVAIDSIVPEQYGFLRNPVISATNSATDNDSSAITALILADFDYYGDASDYDVVGFYNKVAHSTDYWKAFDLAGNSEIDMQADLAFSDATNEFYGTYFNATDGELYYIKADADLTVPQNWNYFATPYNDATTGLGNPYPQVAVNPMGSTASFTWVQNNGTNDVALFDAEGATVSVASTTESAGELSLYPNPAVRDIHVAVTLKGSSQVSVSIFNSMGQLVLANDLGTVAAGSSNHVISVDALPKGNYFVRVTGERFVKTEQLVKY